MAEALKRPGGELASRPLHFFWVVDCSGSMYGEKIGTVNHAIQSTIPEMVDAAKDNPNAQLLVRTLKFSTGATWVTPDPANIEDFAWDDLDAGGVTDLGKAFEMLAAQLTIPPMTDRALPPVIVLLSDGQPTDDYKKSLDTQHRRSKTCSGCGVSTYDYADHSYSYGSWTKADDVQHKRSKTCAVCGDSSTEYGNHKDTNADGVCDDCGANVALIVTWDASSNGGSVGGKNSVTTSVAPNQTAVAPGYTPVKAGHTFSGWYTEKANGTLYSTVTITAARTFYAQFAPAEYKITWDLGTGKTETTNQTYGETLNLPAEPARRGYAFLGWFTQETGGTQVDGNTVFKEVASTTYYAHWEEATVFSVVVPAVLPVTVDQNGTVYVSNAEIVNHSTAAVQVSSVTLTAENGWTLVPYASDMSHAKVDSNQIGFKINSAQTSKTGSTEQLELTSPWQINEEESLTLTYDAVVSALSQPVTNANILCVLFVVEWA